MECFPEYLFFGRFRKNLFSRIRGKLLEAGVATAKNIPYYPKNARITAVDLSEA